MRIDEIVSCFWILRGGSIALQRRLAIGGVRNAHSKIFKLLLWTMYNECK